MIGLLGLDHRDTTAEARGRLAFAEERLAAALHALAGLPEIVGVALLSTCNRTELYLSAPDWPAAHAAARQFLAVAYAQHPDAAAPISAASGAPTLPEGSTPSTARERPRREGRGGSAPGNAEMPSEIERALYAYEGGEAVRHLFLVAAGLRSMVLGEAQILGQVKDALLAADQAGTLDEELRALFTQAIKAGKRARSETEIGRADVSVARLALDVASRALGGLDGKAVLLIGAGRTSQLCAELARREGVAQLFFANRTASVAAEVAHAIGGEPLTLAEIPAWLPDVDVVVSATAAPHVILTAAAVAEAMSQAAIRGAAPKPLLIVDLAVPPDVEAHVGLLPGVTLYTLDALRAGSGDGASAHGSREAELARAERLVEESVREYVRGQTLRLAVPGITALRRHVDRSATAELERALGRLEHLDKADREVVAQLSRRLVDKMFHHLVSRVRSLAEYDEVPPQITMQVLARLLADPNEGRPESPQHAHGEASDAEASAGAQRAVEPSGPA
jgi:glutamyl-tRNA reductase